MAKSKASEKWNSMSVNDRQQLLRELEQKFDTKAPQMKPAWWTTETVEKWAGFQFEDLREDLSIYLQLKWGQEGDAPFGLI